ncbi:MAG: hypothetical protein JRJ12_15250 [Deltaproteobacteria bacterium]|nr:hypothetical protein [Deltaproteobacteria bacterium]MBW2072208.1 hypothetical protein [Deltaproteobacteria bacterium]
MQQIDYKKKGNKLIIKQEDLDKYLDKKLQDLSNLLSNTIIAVIILSVMVVIQVFRASDIYLYGLILLPLIAKGFVYSRIEAHLRKSFKELLSL